MWQNIMNFQQIFQNVTEYINLQQIFQNVTGHSALSHSLVAMMAFFCICTLECGQKLWKFRYRTNQIIQNWFFAGILVLKDEKMQMSQNTLICIFWPWPWPVFLHICVLQLSSLIYPFAPCSQWTIYFKRSTFFIQLTYLVFKWTNPCSMWLLVTSLFQICVAKVIHQNLEWKRNDWTATKAVFCL